MQAVSHTAVHEIAPTVKKKTVLDSDSEDDVPLGQRFASPHHLLKKSQLAAKQNVAAKQRDGAQEGLPAKPERNGTEKKVKRKREAAELERAVNKKVRRKDDDKSASSCEIKWTTLSHAGVLFPPEYTPHGVKMLYDGAPVTLTAEQEEVATFFAVMKETDYMKKKQFLANFWAGFQAVLGKSHTIRSLEKCDFTPIYEWHMAEREKKKALPKEEKDRLKAEKEAAEKKYKSALVDGKPEQVGNFRVEPPGLFRGRGEHPKMGKLKRRIYPKDITINIGKGEPVPEHPYPGQRWKEVRHDQTVTWLAYWKDPVSDKDFKYVWLAANSSFKSDSDQAKYEKARKLKLHIGAIRAAYEKDWTSADWQRRQMGTAMYFIDKLALRAGHEKDEDEADTVGCCTLKVENVECLPDNHIRFDFLGKDSIRYENEVRVEEAVYNNVKQFWKRTAKGAAKQPEDQLFDTFDATDLNKVIKDFMDGLSVKVFRTYNASITLDRLLWDSSDSTTLDERKADYDRANKEVAILCNHQRAVPKGHAGQMEKMQERAAGLMAELHALQEELKAAEKGKALSPGKKPGLPVTIKNKILRKKEQISQHEVRSKVKEDLKTVALGTSKINYLDPRITVAWCKRNEVPLEKIFNKSLLSKFNWSMTVEPDFKF